MGEAQLFLVPMSGGGGLSAEQASLTEAGFDALGLAAPDDFGRPGARVQLLLSADNTVALVTVAAVGSGSTASIALANPDRLRSGPSAPATVRATTNLFAAGHLEEETTQSGIIAVIAPHGGGIERETDSQVDLLAGDTRLQVDTWICRGMGAQQFRRLHITSDDLSEQSFPGFRALLDRPHRLAVSFHGFDAAISPRDNRALDVIVGGQLDLGERYDVAELIRRRLPLDPAFQVFVATECGDPHSGLSPKNAVNRLSQYRGLQIEQSLRLRQHPAAPSLVAEAVIEALIA